MRSSFILFHSFLNANYSTIHFCFGLFEICSEFFSEAHRYRLKCYYTDPGFPYFFAIYNALSNLVN